jgi:Concanavalin A-like lectin/glucanases superfamily
MSRKHWRTALIAGLVMPGFLVGSGQHAGAAATTTIALYQMNESPGSTVLVDSSGSGLNGKIGSEVMAGTVVSGATAHRFGYLKPNTPPAHPGHLDSVPNTSKLDPGTSDYAVTMRVKWTNNFGNMIQKGQSGGVGGYWKWEAPSGVVHCLFRDSKNVSKSVNSKTPLNDGQWHTIRCERTSTGVTMTVDGKLRATGKGKTGSISNTKPLTIAGKGTCDQISVTCDYFVGDIDWVRIEKG